MKYFFWLGVLAYVFVYFYAAWVYEGFSMPLAIVIFVLLVSFVYWRYKRHIELQAQQQAQQHLQAQSPTKSEPPKNLSIWSSPLPYMAILVIIVVYSVLQM